MISILNDLSIVWRKIFQFTYLAKLIRAMCKMNGIVQDLNSPCWYPSPQTSPHECQSSNEKCLFMVNITQFWQVYLRGSQALTPSSQSLSLSVWISLNLSVYLSLSFSCSVFPQYYFPFFDLIASYVLLIFFSIFLFFNFFLIEF